MTGIDLHTHTTFDHGKHTPEEMVKKAIELKMDLLGLAVHSPGRAGETWTATKEGLAKFLKEMKRLKKVYDPKIWLLAGIEADYHSDGPWKGFDYVIGSVHWLEYDCKLYPVDQSKEALCEIADRFEGGDLIAVAEKYYRTVGDVVRKTGCDVIGHFDLITKFNENGVLFNENDPRYVSAWQMAAKKLLKTGKPFEINTGAMSRGYRTLP